MLQIAAILLSLVSAWFAVQAIRELGKQWSLQARVLEDHQLVTSGVYGMVRHPIYTAMLGMLIATGLVIGQLMPLGIGLVIFLGGTLIRIRLEERLLKAAFGKQFESWSEKVPALIPKLRLI
jgi:protein-S-isoprenylcysteine O-methyltransferase Ste14